ncbi:hypothetical protein D3C84_911260 [compost metagenome]
MANSTYLLHAYGCRSSITIIPAKRAKIEKPIAMMLLRKAAEIIKAIVTKMTVDTQFSRYVFHRFPNMFLSIMLPASLTLTSGKFHNSNLYSSPFNSMETIKRITSRNKPNIIIDIYFDTKIFVRFAGLISSSLIVPVVNSPAKLSPATMTVNNVIKIINSAEVSIPLHIVPPSG